MFNTTMQRILKEYLGMCCKVNVGNVYIYICSDTETQYNVDIENLFQALNNAVSEDRNMFLWSTNNELVRNQRHAQEVVTQHTQSQMLA